jgi:hypothetical protein
VPLRLACQSLLFLCRQCDYRLPAIDTKLALSLVPTVVTAQTSC